jgi:hypothetical protein
MEGINSKYMQNENNKFIPRTQMQSILDNAPQGVDKKALIDKFVTGGFTVEGVNDKKEPNMAQTVASTLIKAPTDLIATGMAGAGALGAYAGKKLSGQDTTLSQEYANQANKVANSGASTIMQPITGEAVRPAQNLEQLGGDVLQTGALAVPGTGLVKGAATGAALGGGMAMSENQSLFDVAKNALIGGAVGGVIGKVLPGVATLPKDVSAMTPAVMAGAEKVASALTPDSANIMQRVLRVTKGQQANFEKKYGTSVGQYAVDRGLIGTQDEVATNLANRFTTSIKAADDALASLPGEFKPEAVRTALEDLYTKKLATSAKGAIDPELNAVKGLIAKFDNVGLNMSEINEAKRLYERNVKLDFVKTNNPEGVKLANNIDDAIRTWQFNQAERLGLKNLPDINKETRMAKDLLNSLEREASGKAGNNAISLTDWIVLADGGAMNMAAFLAKKGFSSDVAQAFVAKYFAPAIKKGLPKAEMGTPQIDATVRSYFDFLKKTGAISQDTQKILKQPGKQKISGVLSSDEVNTISTKKASRVISEDAYQAAKKNFKDNMGRINSGVPVDQIKDLSVMAAYHIENGVKSVAELTVKLASEGYKLTKTEIEKLFLKANAIQTGARLDMNKIDEAETLLTSFSNGKFSSKEMANSAKQFIVDNGLDYKKTLSNKETQDLLGSIVEMRKDLRQIVSKTISKELQPLAEEAKKYKSAVTPIEKFASKYKTVEGLKSDLPRFDSLADLSKNVRALNLNRFPRLEGDDIITVYRGAHPDSKGITAGDWITLDEKTAKNYSKNVQTLKIKKSDVVNPGIEKDEYIFAPRAIDSSFEDLLAKTNNK